MFDKRMEAHKEKKRNDIINELMKHADLIEDPKVKEYVIKKNHNFAVAIDSDHGLTTPNLKAVNDMNILQIN